MINFKRFIVALFFLCTFYFTSPYGFAESQKSQLGKLEVKSGSIIFSGNKSILDVNIKLNPRPQCEVELVEAPVRVVIKCRGKFFSKYAPLNFSGTDLANGARFGMLDGFSRIVIDINGNAPTIMSTTATDGTPVFSLNAASSNNLSTTPTAISTAAVTAVTASASETPVKKAVKDTQIAENNSVTPVVRTSTPLPATPTSAPTATATAIISNTPKITPTPSAVGSASNGSRIPEPAAMIMTPAAPLPRKFGETELYSLLFVKDAITKSPAIRISLKDQTKVEIKKDSAENYTLKITGARIASPIFGQIQKAPEGFEPFVSVLVTESTAVGKAVDLIVKIEVKKDAALLLKENGKDIEVVAGR